jgi:hypothetical protein
MLVNQFHNLWVPLKFGVKGAKGRIDLPAAYQMKTDPGTWADLPPNKESQAEAVFYYEWYGHGCPAETLCESMEQAQRLADFHLDLFKKRFTGQGYQVAGYKLETPTKKGYFVCKWKNS